MEQCAPSPVKATSALDFCPQPERASMPRLRAPARAGLFLAGRRFPDRLRMRATYPQPNPQPICIAQLIVYISTPLCEYFESASRQTTSHRPARTWGPSPFNDHQGAGHFFAGRFSPHRLAARGLLPTPYATLVSYRSAFLRIGCIGVARLLRGPRLSQAMRPRSRRLCARKPDRPRQRHGRRSCACSLASWPAQASHARPS